MMVCCLSSQYRAVHVLTMFCMGCPISTIFCPGDGLSPVTVPAWLMLEIAEPVHAYVPNFDCHNFGWWMDWLDAHSVSTAMAKCQTQGLCNFCSACGSMCACLTIV
jgi:hypothetical protein